MIKKATQTQILKNLIKYLYYRVTIVNPFLASIKISTQAKGRFAVTFNSCIDRKTELDYSFACLKGR